MTGDDPDRRLAGGRAGGAELVAGTVRRPAGPWTPAVHALLRHLADRGFAGAPRPRGIDGQGREIVTHLAGETVGSARPWPAWTHSDDALAQVAGWLRRMHVAVADFRPPPEAVWREGGIWREGLIIGHGDPGAYNACWRDGQLVGFFDWDFAGPTTPAEDLAWTVFAWVPLHARRVVETEGFTAFEDLGRRLRLFLATYGWTGDAGDLLPVVHRRIHAAVAAMRRTAAAGDPAYAAMIARGTDTDLEQAARELADLQL